MNFFKSFIEVFVSLLFIMTAIWGFFKLYYRYKSKLLFITNCQLLHKNIWYDLSEYYNIKQNGSMDFAFRPLVLLPISLKKYSNLKNGKKAVLESINPNRETKLKIVAEVYWIPKIEGEGKNELEKRIKVWNTISQPVFSLVLRRYFGIEMPMYQDEKEEDVKAGWKMIRHHAKHLLALNKTLDKDHLQWLMSDRYTYRFFNASAGDEGAYEGETGPDSFIEYCGLSIVLRNHSIIHIEKD